MKRIIIRIILPLIFAIGVAVFSLTHLVNTAHEKTDSRIKSFKNITDITDQYNLPEEANNCIIKVAHTKDLNNTKTINFIICDGKVVGTT